MADLAGGTWIANAVAPAHVVDISCLSGQLVICPLSIGDADYWITFPHDHVGSLLSFSLMTFDALLSSNRRLMFRLKKEINRHEHSFSKTALT